MLHARESDAGKRLSQTPFSVTSSAALYLQSASGAHGELHLSGRVNSCICSPLQTPLGLLTPPHTSKSAQVRAECSMQQHRLRQGVCHADATPEDVVGVLTASGVWGAVHESAESGPFNANVLDGTPAILDNIDTFDALHAVPSMITVAGGSAGFGPRAINITLTQVPPRAALPRTLVFCCAVMFCCCSARRCSPAYYGWGPQCEEVCSSLLGRGFGRQD